MHELIINNTASVFHTGTWLNKDLGFVGQGCSQLGYFGRAGVASPLWLWYLYLAACVPLPVPLRAFRLLRNTTYSTAAEVRLCWGMEGWEGVLVLGIEWGGVLKLGLSTVGCSKCLWGCATVTSVSVPLHELLATLTPPRLLNGPCL
jgi:hypothetical protein